MFDLQPPFTLLLSVCWLVARSTCCRDVFSHEVEGLLVPERDAVALTEAIAGLANYRDCERHPGTTAQP